MQNYKIQINKKKVKSYNYKVFFLKTFKIKKKTYTDKNAEDKDNKELLDKQQRKLKTKTEGEDFVFEEGTGKAILKILQMSKWQTLIKL